VEKAIEVKATQPRKPEKCEERAKNVAKGLFCATGCARSIPKQQGSVQLHIQGGHARAATTAIRPADDARPEKEGAIA